MHLMHAGVSRADNVHVYTLGTITNIGLQNFFNGNVRNVTKSEN